MLALLLLLLRGSLAVDVATQPNLCSITDPLNYASRCFIEYVELAVQYRDSRTCTNLRNSDEQLFNTLQSSTCRGGISVCNAQADQCVHCSGDDGCGVFGDSYCQPKNTYVSVAGEAQGNGNFKSLEELMTFWEN